MPTEFMEHERRLNFAPTCKTPLTYAFSLEKLFEFPMMSKVQ